MSLNPSSVYLDLIPTSFNILAASSQDSNLKLAVGYLIYTYQIGKEKSLNGYMYLLEHEAMQELDLKPDYASQNYVQLHSLKNSTLFFLFQEFMPDGNLPETSNGYCLFHSNSASKKAAMAYQLTTKKSKLKNVIYSSRESLSPSLVF